MCRNDLPELAVFKDGNAAGSCAGQDRSAREKHRAVHAEGGADLGSIEQKLG